MNSSIEQDPPGPERLEGESARAYQAFCNYRDLGPDRSLDRAWQRFCAAKDPSKDHSAKRRPGFWADWSVKYHWVKRTEIYDYQIEDEKLQARAERREKLREMRGRFELEHQERSENQVRKISLVLDQECAARRNEVIRVTDEKAAGVKTTTTIRGRNLPAIAALGRVCNELAKQAIRGVRDEDPKEEEGEVVRVTWVPADPRLKPWRPGKDRNTAEQSDPKSGQASGSKIGDLNTHLADSETEEAA
jgi:hypothetical protein